MIKKQLFRRTEMKIEIDLIRSLETYIESNMIMKFKKMQN